MRIFKAINDHTGNTKFVGFHTGSESDLLLSLFAVGEGISKSALLRSIVSTALNNVNPHTVVARRAHRIWELESKTRRPPLIEFRRSIFLELSEKGIPSESIDEVIKDFDALVKKKSK